MRCAHHVSSKSCTSDGWNRIATDRSGNLVWNGLVDRRQSHTHAPESANTPIASSGYVKLDKQDSSYCSNKEFTTAVRTSFINRRNHPAVFQNTTIHILGTGTQLKNPQWVSPCIVALASLLVEVCMEYSVHMHTEPVGFFTLQLLHQECVFWLFFALGIFSSAIFQELTSDNYCYVLSQVMRC